MGRGRAPCCEKVGLKKGSWTPAEDMRLVAYIQKYGHGNWRALPKQAGLLRCGKSCRLRWINYLRPDIKRGNFTKEEEDTIIRLHELLGNKWSKIASRLPGRTDNEIKNVWNTHLKKRVASRERSLVPGEPPRSPSSNSTTSPSCSNQAGESDKDRNSDVLPADEQTSKACNESPLDDIIEIPIEANLDMWDMLEEASPHSDIGSNAEDIPVCGLHWDKQVPLQVLPPLSEEPIQGSLSASSSFSDITYCNMSEAGVETVPQTSAHPEDVDTISRVPDIPPIDPELYWNFFEVDSNLFDDIPGFIEKELAKDAEGHRWNIAYLERELDLAAESGGGPPSHGTPASNPVQPPDTGEDWSEASNVETDPIASYFQRQHLCPSPFSLSFTDISMT